MVGSNTAVAEVAGHPVDISVVQTGLSGGPRPGAAVGAGQPDEAAREQMAETALTSVLRERVLGLEEKRLGVAVPDAVVRQQVDAVPAFLTNGVFDKSKFAQVLEQNNTTPDQFVHDLTAEIAGQQLVIPLVAGAAPPQELVNQIFSFIAEQRFAEMVQIPFAAQAAAGGARRGGAAALLAQSSGRSSRRRNTARSSSSCSRRLCSPRMKPCRRRRSMPIYARVAAASPSVPLRSVQVIVVGNLAASSQLAGRLAQRRQLERRCRRMAKRFGANPVEMDGTQQNQIPTPTLASAVFAAPPKVRSAGPIAGPAGMFLFKVTNISSSGPDEATLKAQIAQQLQLQMAQAQVAASVNALQDALAGQTPLDQLPANLGLTAVEGTLDANGNTPTGGQGADCRATRRCRRRCCRPPSPPARTSRRS